MYAMPSPPKMSQNELPTANAQMRLYLMPQK